MATLQDGSRLGPFEILAPLGAGGMGEVYRARDSRLGREVAIKILPAAASADAERLQRFEREARAASSLSHPNILTVYELDRHEGAPYLVTELLRGETLRERLATGALPLREALSIAIEVGRGLGAAHEHGIVHRDLKPENLFLVRGGGAKILDFGLARLLPPAGLASGLGDLTTVAGHTEPGALLGTVGYMAPEQVRGEPADARSDLFAFGIVLYEMLAGRRAFARPTAVDTLSAILNETPPALDSVASPALPISLRRVVERCLEKRPENRFQTARDLTFALEEIAADRSGAAAPAAALVESGGRAGSERAPRVARKLAALAAIVAVLALGAYFIRQGSAPAAGPLGDANPAQVTIAVLPFVGEGLPDSIAHLARAVPDEIVTELTYAPQLAVRPFTSTARFDPGKADLAAIGREVGASRLVTGRLAVSPDQLEVSLEVIDTDHDRLVWRHRIEVPRSDLLALRQAMTESVRGGLVPALGGSAGASGRSPHNAESYALYLRALSASHDPQPNRDAVAQLDGALNLDPEFAPGWLELGRRLEEDALFGGGGEAAGRRAIEAVDRALVLDPELAEARSLRITLATDRGRLAEAYAAARDLVERRPGDGRAHGALAYVMRYGGALTPALRECETTRRLDPLQSSAVGCPNAYFQLGDLRGARAFLMADAAPSPAFLTLSFQVDLQMREGDFAGARRSLERVPEFVGKELQRACLESRSAAEIDRALAREGPEIAATPDIENQYWAGAVLAACGRKDAALDFLDRAVRGGYCAAAGFEHDSLLRSLAGDPRFEKLREVAVECRRRFLEQTGLQP